MKRVLSAIHLDLTRFDWPKARLLGAGKPAIENSDLLCGQVFIEANAHAESGTDVDDAPREIDFFGVVAQTDTHHRFRGRWIERVDVTAGATDIASARAEPSASGDFGDFGGGDQWYARIGALVLHSSKLGLRDPGIAVLRLLRQPEERP